MLTNYCPMKKDVILKGKYHNYCELEGRYSEQEQPRRNASKSPPWIGGWWLIVWSWKFRELSRRLFGREFPVRHFEREDAQDCIPRTRVTDEARISRDIQVLWRGSGGSVQNHWGER